MHRGSSFFYASIPEIEHAPCQTESKLQPLIKITTITTVC